MTSLLQKTLGDAWHQLPRALQAHYRAGASVDEGHMVVEYPAFMQPVLHLLARWGALVSRRGPDVHTSVEKLDTADRLHWRRTMRFGDGSTHHFDSVWEPGAPGHVIDFVNPWLGLQMRPCVVGEQLHYQGVNFIVRLRRWTLRLPEWLAPGHTTIVERALDERRYAMDFRMTHPWFGQTFRYAGTFEADVGDRAGAEGGVDTRAP